MNPTTTTTTTTISLAIIGVQKAGTTSLKNYLGSNPKLVTHPHEEFAYFINTKEQQNGFQNTLAQYCIHIDELREKKLVVKNVGMCMNEESIEKLKSHSPDCHIAIILRNPTERAYSSYTMGVVNGWMSKSFSEVIDAIEKWKKGEYDIMYNQFVRLGLYIEQLRMIYKYFSKEQVSIYLFEDLKSNPKKICQELCDMIGVNNSTNLKTDVHNQTLVPRSKFLTSIIHQLRNNNSSIKQIIKAILPPSLFKYIGDVIINSNKSNTRFPKMDKQTREYLNRFYKPYNLALQELTGIDLSHWNMNEEA
ncbi:sulfotransferase family protein [Sediminitomix flava]|uniref:Sulfotransferase domain-containing protein n=1 Tax=Sediminitomix flava TaxID=379075 RepID=A0A315ZCM3_SEDFL|nr:sulfotransferase [Sediminitomix flava]PWJ43291.1 sulfotransferase domain-containing protein [Sediminitomix flava]